MVAWEGILDLGGIFASIKNEGAGCSNPLPNEPALKDEPLLLAATGGSKHRHGTAVRHGLNLSLSMSRDADGRRATIATVRRNKCRRHASLRQHLGTLQGFIRPLRRYRLAFAAAGVGCSPRPVRGHNSGRSRRPDLHQAFRPLRRSIGRTAGKAQAESNDRGKADESSEHGDRTMGGGGFHRLCASWILVTSNRLP